MPIDVGYTLDEDPCLENPERGMYFERLPTGNDCHTLVPRWLWLHSVCGQDLTWNGFDRAGTSPVLNDYARDQLEPCRRRGVKVVFRPRYDQPDGNTPSACTSAGHRLFQADSKVRQKNHIDAVASMLFDYRQVIAFVQAGYLGRWGEWNTEGYAEASAPLLHDREDRVEILGHLLSAYAAAGVPHDVELRRPVFAREAILEDPDAKVGLHNDCFMTSNSDMGTYSDVVGSLANFGSSAAAKAWARGLTEHASFGGETCPRTAEDDVSNEHHHTERWRSCSTMLTEPATLHMSYLNGDYAPTAVATWTQGGCYDEIRSRLGYRFHVTRVAYTPTVAWWQNVWITVDVENSGWARLHGPRDARLVLRHPSRAPRFLDMSAGATRDWAPGTTTRLSVAPGQQRPPAGTYEVRLAIFDPADPPGAPTIPYAVRLASKRNGVGVFDTSTGDNDLGVSITVRRRPWWLPGPRAAAAVSPEVR